MHESHEKGTSIHLKIIFSSIHLKWKCVGWVLISSFFLAKAGKDQSAFLSLYLLSNEALASSL